MLYISFSSNTFGYYRFASTSSDYPSFKFSLPQESLLEKQVWSLRQRAVRRAFLHSWNAYVRDAWGADEYHPISHSGTNLSYSEKGIGFTIVDSIDTLLLMNLTKEYTRARNWVVESLDFDQDISVSLFETTIRVLGGLLSAYHLSGNDTVFLEKARDLGDRLVSGGFNFSEGQKIPEEMVSLMGNSEETYYRYWRHTCVAAIGSLQLEFKYLSYLTGDYKYWRRGEEMIEFLDSLESVDGLLPLVISTDGTITQNRITVGGQADSYYEYLLKQNLQTAHTEPTYRRMYNTALYGAKTRLLKRSTPNKFAFFAELWNYQPNYILPRMEHLTCFMGATIALGATNGSRIVSGVNQNETWAVFPDDTLVKLSAQDLEDLEIAKEVTETCSQMYFGTKSGLSPDAVSFVTEASSDAGMYRVVEGTSGEGDPLQNDTDPEINTTNLTDGDRVTPKVIEDLVYDQDNSNLLRPETVESLFVLWRVTGDKKYREYGWRIFKAFEKYSRYAEGGYTSHKDVTVVPPVRNDKMETFWLAETLKYFYLLFEPADSALIRFDKYVFNTEAHPFPVFTPDFEKVGTDFGRFGARSKSNSDDQDETDNSGSDDVETEET